MWSLSATVHFRASHTLLRVAREIFDNKQTLPYKKPHSDAGAGAGEDDMDSDTSINSDRSSDGELMPSPRPHEVGELVHVNMGVDSHDAAYIVERREVAGSSEGHVSLHSLAC